MDYVKKTISASVPVIQFQLTFNGTHSDNLLKFMRLKAFEYIIYSKVLCWMEMTVSFLHGNFTRWQYFQMTCS